MASPDELVDRSAAQVLGLITHALARAAGLSDDQIDQRCRSGRWIRLAPGVYRVAGAPVTWRQHLMAACLACPPGSVGSHLSSLAVHLLYEPPVLPHVTLERSTSGRTRLAKVHWSSLHPLDVMEVGPIPVTTPARAIVESAALLDRARLERVVDDAFCRRLTNRDGVTAAAERAGKIHGSRLLREVLDVWAPGIEPGSPAEVRLVRQVRERGYGELALQHRVTDSTGRFLGRIDAALVDLRIGLEYDSERWHNPRRWSRDEVRHADVEAIGWTLLHVEKPDLLPGARAFWDRLDGAVAVARRRRAGAA